MATSVNIHEAKTQFSKLVRRGSEPVAQIGPLKEKRQGVRGFGSMKGEIRIGPDFDEPLEEFAEYEK